MTTQYPGATNFKGPHHTPLLWQQRVAMAKVCAVLAKDVGHLKRWSGVHFPLLGMPARASSGLTTVRSVCAETLV